MSNQELTEIEFLDYTIRTFQPYYDRILTREDAREIANNAVGFFTTLIDFRESANMDSTK